MSLTVSWGDGDDQSQALSTNSGWSAFGKWADSLDHHAYPQVVTLWEHGFVRNVAALATQLSAALSHFPPDDPTVRDTAAGLLRACHAAGKADHLAVDNGMGPDDGGEDEWDEEAANFDPPEMQAQESIFDDPIHGATLETLVHEAVGRVLEDIGPPPFAGAVFDKSKHRWVKPADASGAAKPDTGDKGDAPQLDDAEKASIGAGIDKDLDKLPEDQRPPATLVAKAKAVAVAAATKVYEWAWRIGESKLGGWLGEGVDAYFDSPMDMRKLGYNPNNSSGTANPKVTDNVSANIQGATGAALGGVSDAVGMDLAMGVSGHLVAKIAATVLSHLVIKIKTKLVGKPATEAAEGDGIHEWAKMIAQLFAHLNEEMGVKDGAPDAATVEANLRNLLAAKA